MRFFRYARKMLYLALLLVAMMMVVFHQGRVWAAVRAASFTVSVSPNPVVAQLGPDGFVAEFDVQVQGATPNGMVSLVPDNSIHGNVCIVTGLPEEIQADASGDATQHVKLERCSSDVFGPHQVIAVDEASNAEVQADFAIDPPQ